MEKNRIIFFGSVFLTIMVLATLGFMILLDVSFIDALYMTVITISTVGYTEVAEMTPEARLFAIGVIFMSIGTGGFLLSKVISSFSEGDVKEAWRKKRMENSIAKLENHYIICGSGETGFYIINQFQKIDVPFVVIDKREEVIEKLREAGVNYIHADATHEETLEKARIGKAKGLVASLSKDSDNVFVVLTARQMNIDLRIIARAIENTSHQKLKRAGANNTVSPNEIGGKRIATLMLKPSIAFFADAIVNTDDVNLDLEEVVIRKDSSLSGIKLRDTGIPEKSGLIVLGIRKSSDNKFHFSPGPDSLLESGDKIVVLGPTEQVESLRKLIELTD